MSNDKQLMYALSLAVGTLEEIDRTHHDIDLSGVLNDLRYIKGPLISPPKNYSTMTNEELKDVMSHSLGRSKSSRECSHCGSTEHHVADCEL